MWYKGPCLALMLFFPWNTFFLYLKNRVTTAILKKKFHTRLLQITFYKALYIIGMSKISKLFQWSSYQIMFTITERLDLQRNELTFQHSLSIAVFSVWGFQFSVHLDKTSVILFFSGIAMFIYSKVNSFEIACISLLTREVAMQVKLWMGVFLCNSRE